MSQGQLERTTEEICGHAFATQLGWMTLVWRDQFPYSMSFDLPTQAAAIQCLAAAKCSDVLGDADLPRRVRTWVRRLTNYAAGQKIDFLDIELDDSECTEFQRRVIAGCRNIPRGKTLSYRELAEIAGSPNAARAVGNVMATNPLPLIVPCHRVVGAAGSLGGYSASSGLTMKTRLLKLEGALG